MYSPLKISIFGIALAILYGFGPLPTFAASFVPVPGTDSMLLPFGSSFSPTPGPTSSTGYHHYIGLKMYVATVLTYVSSTSQKQIYKVLRSTDATLGQEASMSLVNNVTPLGVIVRGTQYFSLSEIKSNSPSIKAAGGSLVGYDFESGTPTSELSNPVGSFATAYKIATANGLVLMCSPTMGTALKYAPQIAKYCPIFNGQGEHGEANTAQYISNYEKLSSEIRTANPNSKIIAEVSTTAPSASLSVMEYDFSHVAPYVDGTSSWFDSSSLSGLNSYLAWFNNHY